MSQISGSGRIERWDAAEVPVPMHKVRSEQLSHILEGESPRPVEFAPPTPAELCAAHSEDLIAHLQAWSAELDAREAVLNAREAMIDHRERTTRIMAADIKRMVDEQKATSRIRGEVLGRLFS